VKDCKTKDNVTCNIDVLILFYITDGYTFVYKLSPEKLDELLRAQQEESIRQMASDTLVRSSFRSAVSSQAAAVGTFPTSEQLP